MKVYSWTRFEDEYFTSKYKEITGNDMKNSKLFSLLVSWSNNFFDFKFIPNNINNYIKNVDELYQKTNTTLISFQSLDEESFIEKYFYHNKHVIQKLKAENELLKLAYLKDRLKECKEFLK
jgi:hypothetical protein